MKISPIATFSVILLISVVFLVGNFTPPVFKPLSEGPLELEIKSLITDKELYHSNEKMNITLDLYASEDAEVDIKIFGIKDRRNNHRLNKVEKRNLTSGINTISYSYTTPSCYGCAGINPGTKQITALVSCENVTDNKTIEIQIER